MRYSEHVRGKGRAFHRQACSHALESIVSRLHSAVLPWDGELETLAAALSAGLSELAREVADALVDRS